MGFRIEDGKGQGNIVQVDSSNRLRTSSRSFDSEEVASLTEGDGFILHGECHVAAATSGGLMHFTNDSTDSDIVVTRIFIDGHSLTDDFIVRQIFDSTATNGTDVSTTGIVNKNRGSGNTLVATLKISDGSSDMTLSGGTNYHAFAITSLASQFRDMRGTNVITPGKSIAWSWATVDGGNAVNGEIISISCNCYRVKRNGD